MPKLHNGTAPFSLAREAQLCFVNRRERGIANHVFGTCTGSRCCTEWFGGRTCIRKVFVVLVLLKCCGSCTELEGRHVICGVMYFFDGTERGVFMPMSEVLMLHFKGVGQPRYA